MRPDEGGVGQRQKKEVKEKGIKKVLVAERYEETKTYDTTKPRALENR